MQMEADKLKTEAETLKGTARREDHTVWKKAKENSTKMASREYDLLA